MAGIYSGGTQVEAWFGKSLKIGFAAQDWLPDDEAYNLWYEGSITNWNLGGGAKDVDGVKLNKGDRLLLVEHEDPELPGIYVLENEGSLNMKWSMGGYDMWELKRLSSRIRDEKEKCPQEGDVVFVEEGREFSDVGFLYSEDENKWVMFTHAGM